MLKKTRQVLKNQQGVTLIELLAVVIILGIIAAIAAPAVVGNFKESKINSDIQTEAILIDAAQRYALGENITTSDTDLTPAELLTDGYLAKDITTWNDTASTAISINITVTPSGNKYKYEITTNRPVAASY